MNPSSNAAKESQKKEMQSASSGGSDSISSDGGSRKRKDAPSSTDADDSAEAASALMNLPRELSKQRESDTTSSREYKSGDDHDLSTIEGQQALNPKLSIEEARFQAKREYNRLNAARARVRNKEMLEDLHGKVASLTRRAEDLERENEILRAQVKVLTAQQQNQQQKQQQQQIQQQNQQHAQGNNQTQARQQQVLNQSSQPEALAVTLLNVLQGKGSAPSMSLQHNQQQSMQNAQANPLAQLFPSLQATSTSTQVTQSNVPAPSNSSNPLDGLSQILKNIQAQQQQQQKRQQPVQMQPQQQQAPPDLQSMLNMLTRSGNNNAPIPLSAPTPTSPVFPPGLAALSQSTGLNENVIKEFLAKQQPQQQQQQQAQTNQQQQIQTNHHQQQQHQQQHAHAKPPAPANQQQQSPASSHNMSFLHSLTGQQAPGSNTPSSVPSALAELLAKADPVTRQNVLANMLQGNPSLGQSLASQMDQSRKEPQHQQNVSSSGGNVSFPTNRNSHMQNGHVEKNGIPARKNGQPAQQLNSHPIPGRDQLNQILPTLSPKTLYSILKQQPDSQHGEQNGETESGSRTGA